MRESVPFGMRFAALRTAFIGASVAWALVLPLAPFVASRPPSGASTAFVIAVYGIGSLVCHQLPVRSYRLWAAQMPVCARCTGIYFGAAAAAFVARGFRPSVGRSPERLALGPRLALLVAATPTALTLIYEWTTGVMPANGIRAAAGLPLGAVVSWLVIRYAHHGQFARPEPVEG